MSTNEGVDDASGQHEQVKGIRSMGSVLNSLRVFEEVAGRQPIGVSELARATGIPKSTVQRCLITLEEAGWIRLLDNDHGQWTLTMRALKLGLRGAGEQDLRQIAGPVIKRLAGQTTETVLLGVRDGDEYLIIAAEDSTQLVRVIMDVGSRIPLRACSAGVAIMALLDDDEVDELLRPELIEFEGSPLPTSAELHREIARTAERGYALDMSSWYRPQVASIGAVIVAPTGHPIGALTLAIPEMRYDRSQEQVYAQMVVEAAADISRLVAPF